MEIMIVEYYCEFYFLDYSSVEFSEGSENSSVWTVGPPLAVGLIQSVSSGQQGQIPSRFRGNLDVTYCKSTATPRCMSSHLCTKFLHALKRPPCSPHQMPLLRAYVQGYKSRLPTSCVASCAIWSDLSTGLHFFQHQPPPSANRRGHLLRSDLAPTSLN